MERVFLINVIIAFAFIASFYKQLFHCTKQTLLPTGSENTLSQCRVTTTGECTSNTYVSVACFNYTLKEQDFSKYFTFFLSIVILFTYHSTHICNCPLSLVTLHLFFIYIWSLLILLLSE